MPSHLPISLIVSGIVVTAVLVAVSRNKKSHKSKQDQNGAPSINEIDMSWLDEFEEKDGTKQSKKTKKKAGAASSSKKTVTKKAVEEKKRGDTPLVVEISSESELEDGLDDIQLLAALQQRQKKTVPSAVIKKSPGVSSTVEVFGAVLPLTEVPETAVPSTEVEDEAEWDSVPTKDELVLSSLRSRIESLGRSLEAAEQAKSVAESILAVAQDKSQRTEADLKARCQALGVRVISLEGELSQARAQAQVVSKRLAHVEEVELTESREEISRLSAILLETEGRLSALKEERQALLARSSRAEEQAAERGEEASRLKENVEALQPFRPKCVALESDLARVQHALGATERDLIGLRSQEASRAAEHKRAMEEQDRKIVALETTIEENITDHQVKEAALMAENIRAANELEAAKAHTGELEAQLKAVKTERDDICAKFGQTEAELEETLAKLSSFEAEKKAFEFALESAKSEIESLKANYEESKKTTAEFKSQFESSAKTIACLNTEIYSKEESISGLTKQVSELEDQLTTARAESSSALESTRSELESVKKRFAEHLVQNAGTKSRKEELEVESLRLNAELATLKAAVFGGVKVTSSGKKQPAKAAPVHASEPTQVPAKSETPLSR